MTVHSRFAKRDIDYINYSICILAFNAAISKNKINNININKHMLRQANAHAPARKAFHRMPTPIARSTNDDKR